MKCENLEWSGGMRGERVIASMSFDDFDQAARFVDMVIKFVAEEKSVSAGRDAPVNADTKSRSQTQPRMGQQVEALHDHQ